MRDGKLSKLIILSEKEGLGKFNAGDYVEEITDGEFFDIWRNSMEELGDVLIMDDGAGYHQRAATKRREQYVRTTIRSITARESSSNRLQDKSLGISIHCHRHYQGPSQGHCSAFLQAILRGMSVKASRCNLWNVLRTFQATLVSFRSGTTIVLHGKASSPLTSLWKLISVFDCVCVLSCVRKELE